MDYVITVYTAVDPTVGRTSGVVVSVLIYMTLTLKLFVFPTLRRFFQIHENEVQNI